MLKLELTGDQPVNRPAKMGARARMIRKITAKSNWFKRQPKDDRESTSRGQGQGQSSHSKVRDPPPESIS